MSPVNSFFYSVSHCSLKPSGIKIRRFTPRLRGRNGSPPFLSSFSFFAAFSFTCHCPHLLNIFFLYGMNV
nr:MAG TPA: hypothetical protein [Caudoviricetes sp.]